MKASVVLAFGALASTACGAAATDAVAAADAAVITKLKDLCIETPLVADGRPLAAIIVPSSGLYADAVQAVQVAIKRCGGCKLPVIADDADQPEELLADRPLIAMGNMSTSRFIETLYRHWYTFLDLRYPGPGGWVVRSLHNPYGTGHNVILLGGSGDEGVASAARQFAAELKPADPLKIGWLMKIGLGAGLKPPEIGETVHSWRDSHRLDPNGEPVGYEPSTTFGWNPISVQGVLYYMTGEEKYLRQFVRLALPDPDNIPEEIRNSYAFTQRAWYDLRHPLVQNYHYHAHIVDLIWDLIEESPLLTDEVRLRITNELRAHQDFVDAEDDWCPAQGASRHGLYDGLCIYTGSRYFAKYYPALRWEKRLDNLRRFFSWWLKHPTWGELDTLVWVNTSTEPVLEYFLMADPQAFVNSGTARTMMSALEILWTGRPVEESNQYQTISLMHKAAYLLNDGRYAYMARNANYDFDVFRLGQSWWPGPGLAGNPPLDRVNAVSVMPLAEPLAARVQAPFEAQHGYQFLSYRTGLGPSDGFLFLDGYNGGGRNPHHVSALKLLRNTGRRLLNGYGNQVAILRDGMAENHVAKAARLDATVALDGPAYIRSVVPDAAYSEWTRDILWVDDAYTLVADTVTARAGGSFEVTCQWEPMGQAQLSGQDPRWAQLSGGNRTTVVCAQPVSLALTSGQLRQTLNARLDEGQSRTLISAVYGDGGAGKFDYRLQPVGESAAVVTGKDEALFTVGPFSTAAGPEEGGFSVYAMATHIGRDRICVLSGHEQQHGIRVASTRFIAEATGPVSFVWDLADGRIVADAVRQSDLALAVAPGSRVLLDGKDTPMGQRGGLGPVHLTAGRHVITGATPRQDVKEMLGKVIDALVKTEPPAPVPRPTLADAAGWAPVWEVELQSRVTHIRPTLAGAPGEPRIWTATEAPTLWLVAPDGQTAGTIELPTKLRAMAMVGPSGGPHAVAAVAGGDDDRLRAFSASGDLVWEAESRVSESHKNPQGGYQAPWFTDPARRSGILALMVGDVTGPGRPEVVLGRPSTVEYWGIDGQLLRRVAIQWGDCTELALLRAEQGPRVLVGKFHTGHDAVSVLSADRQVVGNAAYTGLPTGSTRMAAWMQRGVVALRVVDLHGDGAQEVVVARSGHWNDLRVFNADGSQCVWQRSFGLARPRSHFVRSLAIGNLDDDAALELAVGLANGWTCCFEGDGTALWTRKFASPVTRLATFSGHLVVGLESGKLALVNSHGETVRSASLSSSITSLVSADASWPAGALVLAGTEAGKLVALAP